MASVAASIALFLCYGPLNFAFVGGNITTECISRLCLAVPIHFSFSYAMKCFAASGVQFPISILSMIFFSCRSYLTLRTGHGDKQSAG
ncbi:hypothetical protein LSTR_LSTR014327 [Laodelphax striatellus]|uniref:Uncharacterized protein n=1 Tax=Laodelphax striatellus TaxID=195883 RepID=A0A482X7M8_LAOST|nr:hypothetical protein LSTR_LSTR014327 [Laodelphax striatellus]